MDIEKLYRHFLNSSGICTDTRKIEPGCIFFALKGENFNGNLFAKQAIELGAILTVIDDPFYESDNTFLVTDVLQTLQTLARYHREQLRTPLIALTGSNGKTTSKELIHSVLSQNYKTVATLGNLNNHIGVPLTLLRLKPETEIGIIEMGANHLGEIKFLSEIAQPDYGYITNFGKAHLEGFGSLEGVIKGKTELYNFLREKQGKVFINGRNIQQLKHSEGIERIIFGPADSDVPVDLIDDSEALVVQFRGDKIHSNLSGLYNFDNIAAAIAIGAEFGLTTAQISKGIESYIPSNSRSQIIIKGTNKIIMDAYNANPTSMLAALENFFKKESYNKILILGDMFELGGESENEHQNIVNFIEEHFTGTTFLVGENFAKTTSKNPYILHCSSFEQFRKEFSSKEPEEALILIKGSRGMALERVLNLL